MNKYGLHKTAKSSKILIIKTQVKEKRFYTLLINKTLIFLHEFRPLNPLNPFSINHNCNLRNQLLLNTQL